MSDHSLGGLYIAERVMDQNVREAHREAEVRRLVHKAKAQGRRSDRFYFGALAWLGQRMTAWGQYLQERYSADGSAPVPQSA